MSKRRSYLLLTGLSVILVAASFLAPTWCTASRLAAFLVYLPPLVYLAVAVLPLWLHPPWRHPLVVVNLGCILVVLLFLLQPRLSREQGRSDFTVLTLNAHYAEVGAAALARFLDGSQASLVFLQEMRETQVERETGLRQQRDPFPVFLKHAQTDWHWVRGTVEKDNDGQILLSRYPLRDTATLWLDRSAPLVAVAETPRGPVRLVNVHLNRGPGPLWDYLRNTARYSAYQSEKLLSQLTLREPVILAGDLNGPPGSPAYRGLCQPLRDAHAVAGLGFPQSFPAGFPLWRLDYILLSPDLVPIRYEVLRGGYSDHRAVRCEVRLRQ